MRLSTALRSSALVAAASLVLTACGGGSGSGGDAGSGGDSGGGDSGGRYFDVAKNPSFEQGTIMAKLAKAGTVKVGTKFKQPYFGLKQLDGTMTGFDVEIAKIIAAGMGIAPGDINWVKTPSKIREQVIEQGVVDYVVATYTINEKRKERVSFVGPYYQAGQTLMVRKDYNKIDGVKDLKKSGAEVCTARGSTSFQNIQPYVKEGQLTLFSSYKQCANALSTGQVDVVTTDNVILLGLIKEGGGEFKLVGEPFTEEPYGIGIPKNKNPFCKYINSQLKKAAKKGWYQEAWNRTAGAAVPSTPKLPELNPCT